MFGILCAIATETIIGIVAIVVIVISVGIIIATAVRNYLLHKKMIAENGGDESFIDNDVVQEIDERADEVENANHESPAITAQDIENAEQIDEVKNEFSDCEEDFEEVQEIDLTNNVAQENENQTQIIAEDLKSAVIDDNSMAELEEKLKNE